VPSTWSRAYQKAADGVVLLRRLRFGTHRGATDGDDGAVNGDPRCDGRRWLLTGCLQTTRRGILRQERHLKYRWNGERVDRYFGYARDEWIDL
jgi:hypothetical protein